MPILITLLNNDSEYTFKQRLKFELENLKQGVLPLEKGLSQGGLVDDSDISVTVLNHQDDESKITAKIAVFFTELVGHCSCSDDFELSAYNAYCEMRVCIDKQTAEVEFLEV